MKFLCDRCKTRYSIGDDRVRGKILKIRCKNCANVITVREGMPEPEAVPAGARRHKTTTAAPVVQAEAMAKAAQPNGALGAAFASALAKPPPALEEEWYVSIDGEQAGPYSLAQAQQWVGSKPFEAELHCWSEGFDDWLPVDKVSHFRGLRKRAPTASPAAMPPPIPRIGGTGPARAIAAAPRIEEEPKPLFAATMASLEKNAPAVASGGGAALSALRVEARAPVVTPTPVPAKPHANGTPRVNLPAAKPAATVRGISPAKPLGFDASETQAEASPFGDEPATTAEVPSSKRTDAPAPNDAFFDSIARSRAEAKAADKPQLSLASLASSTNETPTLRADSQLPALPDARLPEPEPEGDLEIGEVSRVVKLADLARPAAKAPAPASAQKRTGAVGKLTGPVGKLTGAVPKINGTGAVPLIAAVDTVPGSLPTPMIEPVAEPPPTSHRRGMIILLISAALLIGVVVVIFVMKINTRDDITGLGTDYEINTERPDNPIGVRPVGPGSAGSAEPPPNPFVPKPPKPPRPTPPKPIIDPPTGNSLRSDEIEGMARSTSATTTACFRRADKGADAIRLADVKKIRVTFKVNPDGSVAPGSVALSENGSATLTSCIQRMVGGWKFRANSGGNFGFVFAKPD